MTDDLKVDKSKFDALLKRMLETSPLPLSKLREEPAQAGREKAQAEAPELVKSKLG